ncbi:MAG: right-handed parallel beta-helix repeat-containing protein [Deltaproteobacteria bacterium]|nr:right-handed parallel beta-helix repeat-containing protein [Deltaproteobacteria bacterium]
MKHAILATLVCVGCWGDQSTPSNPDREPTADQTTHRDRGTTGVDTTRGDGDPSDEIGDGGYTGKATFFVAVGGNDLSDGSEGAPFATLERARTAIRALRATQGVPEGGVVVYLRGGIYQRSSSFVLDAQDAGDPRRPLVFQSYPGERAQIVGGRRVPAAAFARIDASSPLYGSLPSASRGRVYAANLNKLGITDFGTLAPRGFLVAQSHSALELFVDGEPMTLARWPDADNFAEVGAAHSTTEFGYASDRPSRWKSSDIWLHGYWRYYWADLRVKATIDTTKRSVTLAQAPFGGIQAGQPYYAENLPEELTVPGEWYLDRKSGTLLLWPKNALTAKSEILVSMLDAPLIHIKASKQIELRDLTLEATRGLLLYIDGGSDNRAVGCTFRNSGVTAVSVSGRRNGIDHSTIDGAGDTGIVLRGGDRASLTKANNYVTNSTLRRFGRISWTYRPAVYALGCGQRIAHNEIQNAPHSGIIFAGNEHLIEFNRVHDVCRFSSDAGAIYSGRDWGYRGNIIRYNFVHDIKTQFTGYGVQGIYLDDCVSGVSVFGNVLYRIQNAAIQHGGGRDVRIENNVIARCKTALLTDGRGAVTINNTAGDSWNLLERLTKDNIQYQRPPWSTAYPELAALPNSWAKISAPGENWRMPEGSVFRTNIGNDNESWLVESGYAAPGLPSFKAIENNLANSDPQFIDEKTLNLGLRASSPAHSLAGFTAIPFDKIGPHP